jgi:hypothetical protein
MSIHIPDEVVEAAAKAMCEAWHYAPIGTPDGDAEWSRKQDQYRKQAKAALNAVVNDARIAQLQAVDAAARCLACVVRKSVNAGPLSKDPTAEGQAWRALRLALGESYDEKGELA